MRAELLLLAFRAEKDGKLRINYAGWEDGPRIVLEGQVFVLSHRS